MNSIAARLAAIAAMTLLAASAVAAQSPAKKQDAPASFTVISPIWGHLVRFSLPAGFVAAFENTKENFYIREAVLKGETARQWSQMITVTGARGMVAAPNFSPLGLAIQIAKGFEKACPESFVTKVLGATKFGDRDGYAVMAGCGRVDASADKHSEMALIVAVQGASDAYTIQWAERAPGSSTPGIDEAKWQERLRQLMPIRLCPIVSGEAAPYPSCLKAP
jgi:hypothetical protein